jgi:hypothetical protein
MLMLLLHAHAHSAYLCCLSTNCSLLDLSSVGEGDVNKVPHNTISSLMVDIMKVMPIHMRDTVAEDSKLLRRRIEAVVEAGGYFFK